MKKINPTDKLSDTKKSEKKIQLFFDWAIEFSKKVVIGVSIIYILACIYSMVMISISYFTGSITALETLITESNETFRIVVGGYLIKSLFENVVKIGGGKVNAYIKLKDTLLKKANNVETEDDENTDNNEDNELPPSDY